jgi:hypothetical protein
MKISDATIEFWKSLSTNDFWEDAIDVEFVCDEQCMYSMLCTQPDNMKKIGKWCPHYCEKLVEILQKESKR